jgi:hypothetical protein
MTIVNKLEALLTDDARVVIYDRYVFIVQATGYIDLLDILIESSSFSLVCIYAYMQVCFEHVEPKLQAFLFF